MGIEAYKVNPWIKFTDETMFMLDMERVITISEVRDETMIGIYEKFVRTKNKKGSKRALSPNMGYLSSISDARISLEKLYRSKES
jgi:hypothetical protein